MLAAGLERLFDARRLDAFAGKSGLSERAPDQPAIAGVVIRDEDL
jgi:hypothetical protein